VRLYEGSRGLCIPHFSEAFLSSNSRHIEDQLLIIQKTHIRNFLNKLNEFIRKKGPLLRWERTEDEKVSYYTAIEKLTSSEGIR
jgi:hypothetical protein